MKKRKHLFLKIVLSLGLAGGLLLADSNLRVVRTAYELVYETLPESFDGFTVVQISDVHGALFGRDNEGLLEKVRAAAPDLIAITGDLADADTDLGRVDALLAGLTPIAPVYYVSGNHEWSDGILGPLAELLKARGVRYLRNEYEVLERGGDAIVLAGVEDPNGWADQPRPDEFAKTLRRERPGDFVVLLGHRNYWVEKYPALPVDLILCGHAHGGIIRLPFAGGLLAQGRSLFPDYDAGVYESGSYLMLVSRGLGNSVPIPRFLNNPELVTVTLRAKS